MAKYIDLAGAELLVGNVKTLVSDGDADVLASANEYADGKDAAIAEAKKAGDDAQADVDALETLVGVIPNGYTATTIAEYAKELADNVAANGYDDTELSGKVDTNTEDIAELGTNKADKATTLGGYGIADAYTKGEVDTAITTAVETAVNDVKANLASALTYKGQKATEAELPTVDNACGDVWSVATTSKGTSAEFVWIVDDEEAGTGHWEELGTALDLTAYAEKTQVTTDIATAKNEANTYADGLNTAMSTRVDEVEASIPEVEAISSDEINNLFA